MKPPTPLKIIAVALFLTASPFFELLRYAPNEKALAQAVTSNDQKAEADRLEKEGEQKYRQGEVKEALSLFQRELVIRKALSDLKGEAVTLHNIGIVYSDLGEKQKALEFYNLSLPLSRAIRDRIHEAATLHNIGKVYFDLGEKQKALDYLNQALPLLKAAGNRAGEAIILKNIGAIYSDLGDSKKALEYYSQALQVLGMNTSVLAQVAQSAKSSQSRGQLLQEALQAYNQGENQTALEKFQKARAQYQEIDDKRGQAVTLSGIGRVYSDLGERQKALDYFNQALSLYKAVGNRGGEASALNGIGSVYFALAEHQKALDYFNQALPLAVGNRGGEATTLNNIGDVYTKLDEFQKGLDYYNKALLLRRAEGDHGLTAATLVSIGGVYLDLGEKQKALELYNQSLPLTRAVKDRRGEAVTLSNIGRVHDALGEKQKALEYYTQALPLLKAVGNRDGEAATLNNIGGVYLTLGEKQKALEYYTQALPMSKAMGDRAGEAATLNNIGLVYSDLGEKQKALEYYYHALPLFRRVGDRSSEAVTLLNMAYSERSRGNLNQALVRIEAALEIVKDLRTKVVNKALQASYFETVQSYYEFYIDLLMQLHQQQPLKGYDALALNASETRRARGLLDLLSEARADIRQGADPKLIEQERVLQQQINAKEELRQKLLSSSKTEAQASPLQQEINSLLSQYQQVQAQLRVTSPRYAALTQPQPLTLAEIQNQVIDDNTLLLEYSLGKDRSYVWAVTKTGITSYVLPKQAEIEALAQQFYSLVKNPSPTPNQSSPKSNRGGLAVRLNPAKLSEIKFKLSQILLQPVAAQLGQKRLLIVGDGALQYVPFAALSKPASSQQTQQNTPLMAEHEIVTLPSASTIAILRRELKGRSSAPKAIAILADPVFSLDDIRVTQKISSAALTPKIGLQSQQIKRSAQAVGLVWNRLQNTRTEAEAIMKLVPEGDRTQAFDFQANLQQALNPALGQYRIVHFATHGFANSVNPELSGVVFSLIDNQGKSQDGYLRLNEIFNLKLPADLVVLSACETGIGKEMRGEGLIGLTRGFMYAGAKRVAVSLWSVPDEGTKELMSRFYRKMLQEKLPPTAALRAAQLEMWRDPKWQDPYNWAAFEVQGEWQ